MLNNPDNLIKKHNENSRINKIIDNITSLMKVHSLSLRKLSKAIGKTQPYLLRLLQGKHPNPGIDSLEAISDFFGISLLQLIGRQPINFNNLPQLNYPDKQQDKIEQQSVANKIESQPIVKHNPPAINNDKEPIPETQNTPSLSS